MNEDLPLGPETRARMVAGIIGEHSAAAKALAELDRLRAKGRNAELIDHRGCWYVFEVPPPPKQGEGE